MITSDDPATSCALYVLVCRDGSLHPVISDESPDACVARYNLGAGTDYSKGRLPVRLAYVFFDLKDRWDAWGIRDSFRALSKRQKLRLIAGDEELHDEIVARGTVMGVAYRETLGRARSVAEIDRGGS